MARNNYKELTFGNDFIFAKVMRNQKLCKKLLEVILGIEISSIEYIEDQLTLDEKPDSKSVRLDVYVNDAQGTVYNIEMQTTDTRNLPKRSRYYQGIIDLNLLMKGENYKSLRRSYIIFICMFDPFGEGRHIYTFENRCREDLSLGLGDETVKVFLNPKSDLDDIDEDLRNFLSYIADGVVRDEFTQGLENEVDRVKTDKALEVDYMTLLMREQEKYEEGMEKGMEKGMKKGALQMLASLVKDGMIALSDAAAKAGMSEEMFKKQTGLM